MDVVDKLYKDYGSGAPRGEALSKVALPTRGKCLSDEGFPQTRLRQDRDNCTVGGKGGRGIIWQRPAYTLKRSEPWQIHGSEVGCRAGRCDPFCLSLPGAFGLRSGRRTGDLPHVGPPCRGHSGSSSHVCKRHRADFSREVSDLPQAGFDRARCRCSPTRKRGPGRGRSAIAWHRGRCRHGISTRPSGFRTSRTIDR